MVEPTSVKMSRWQSYLVTFLCVFLAGVLETLVEKHFPAPDRNRINKILGISETSKEFKDIIDEVTGKTSKRKPGKTVGQSNWNYFCCECDVLFGYECGLFLHLIMFEETRMPWLFAVRQAAQRAAKKRFKDLHSDNEEDSDFEMSGKWWKISIFIYSFSFLISPITYSFSSTLIFFKY